MGTVRDLINRSFRLIGVLAAGETPSAQEQTDAFNTLNDMISDWSNQSLFITSILRESFPTVAGQGTYTMGVGGNFNTVRPQSIENCLIVAQATPETELPMTIINKDQYAGIIVKSVTSSIPLFLYPDYGFPFANLNIWPVPSVVTNLILYSWKPLASFVTVNDTVALPTGYQRALIYNLALELAPEYGKEPSPTVLQLALEAKAVVKRLNIRPDYMTVDEGVLTQKRGFNWLTGD